MEEEGGEFKHRVNAGCAGLCNDVEKRRIAIAVAVDSAERE